MESSNAAVQTSQNAQQPAKQSSRNLAKPLPGWLTYAGTMLAIGGVFGLVDGIAMVSKSKIYVSGETYMFGNLAGWGWTFIALGVLQILIALGVFAASRLAIAGGVFLAAVYILAELIASAHFPLWALVLIGIQTTIIFGLIRGNTILEERAM